MTLLLGEVALRLMGYRAAVELRHPPILEYEPTLGWEKKPGRIVDAPYVKGGAPITYTNWSSLLRATGPALVDKPRKIVITGCSFTYGLALSDDETWPWKLQERLPEYEVLNLATPAYGTYQSLVILERYLATVRKADIVIYGLIAGHGMRNVASADGLSALGRRERDYEQTFPYVTLENDVLKTHNIELVKFPGRTHSALIRLLELAYYRLVSGDQGPEGNIKVLLKLVLRMKQLAESHGARFYVVDVDLANAQHPAPPNRLALFERNGIGAIDCSQNITSPAMTVAGEYTHPSSLATTLFADCVQRHLFPLPKADKMANAPISPDRSASRFVLLRHPASASHDDVYR